MQHNNSEEKNHLNESYYHQDYLGETDEKKLSSYSRRVKKSTS